MSSEQSPSKKTYAGAIGTVAMWAAIVGVCVVGWKCQVDTNAAIVSCIKAGASTIECREAIE